MVLAVSVDVLVMSMNSAIVHAGVTLATNPLTGCWNGNLVGGGWRITETGMNGVKMYAVIVVVRAMLTR